jgi:hypothetical protein
MSFGLQVTSESGQITYDSSMVTWNQVDFFLVPANDSVGRTYPFLDGKEIQVMLIFVDAPPADRKAVAPTVVIGSTTVNLSGGTVAVYAIVLMR